MRKKKFPNQYSSMRLLKDLSWGTAMFISTALLITAFILFFSYTGCVLDNKKQEKTIPDKTVIVNATDTLK
jgi:hypothetical protein